MQNVLYDYQPAWHEPDPAYLQPLRSIYNRLPVNARLYMEYGLGRTSPITEKDFSPADLQAIREQDRAYQTQNAEDYARARSAQDRLGVDNALQMDQIGGLIQDAPQDTYDYLRSKYAKQAEDYERWMRLGRTPVAKYEGPAGQIDEQGWGNVLRGLTDPHTRIGTSLGRYTVTQTPHGRMAVDTYDFNRYGSERDEPFSMNMLRNPVKGLDWFMRKYHEGPALPVQVMVPK